MYSFHQPNPHHICQNIGAVKSGTCFDHRCSLACRRNFAWKESMLLTDQLNAFARAGFHVYFGNLKVRADIPGDNHLANRKDFQSNLRFLSHKQGWTFRLYCISEVGQDLRLHDHYAMVSNVSISHTVVKKCWDYACSPFPTTVHHSPPRKAIVAGAKYLTKDRWKDRKGKSFIRLFARGSISMTWGSRPFFVPSKDELWKAIQRSRKRQQQAAATT